MSDCIFATKACVDNRKKLLNSNISSTCPHNMANFGPLTQTAEIGSGVYTTPSKFQRVSRLAFVTAPTSLTGGQPVQTLHFTSKSCVLLYWQRYCTALQQRASAKLCGVVQGSGTRNLIKELSQRASPIFGWAAITLGIGPHSSFITFAVLLGKKVQNDDGQSYWRFFDFFCQIGDRRHPGFCTDVLTRGMVAMLGSNTSRPNSFCKCATVGLRNYSTQAYNGTFASVI